MIDFEATVKLIQKDRSGTHSCHPACPKCVGYAHLYVEAALGDESLYQIDWVAFEEQLPHEFAIVAQSENIVTQVWPKETDDE